MYKANAKQVLIEGGRAVGVKLADGREYRGRAVVSNATRWDTFGHLVAPEHVPTSEHEFRWVDMCEMHG